MEFLSKVFSWIANLSAKLPSVNFKAFFIVVLVSIAVVGLGILASYLWSRPFRLNSSCNKIKKYLDKVDSIDDENLADFINQCFTKNIPASLKNSWLEYLNVRFGFPSDIVSDKNVYDSEVVKAKNYRPQLFLAISLILLGIFAFWGFGTIEKISMSVVQFFGLVLIGVTYILLLVFDKKLNAHVHESFYNMQEELDIKVDLQIEKNYATDSSPLTELAELIDDIIARNTAKIVDLTEEMNSVDEANSHQTTDAVITPIETLIAIEEAMEGTGSEGKVEESEAEQQPEEKVEETLNEAPENKEPVKEETTEPQEEKESTFVITEEQKQKLKQLLQYYKQKTSQPQVVEQEIEQHVEEETYIQPEESTESIYQDMIPYPNITENETIAPKSGLRLGKNVGLDALEVEDVLMGADFSEAENLEPDEPIDPNPPVKRKRGRPRKNPL